MGMNKNCLQLIPVFSAFLHLVLMVIKLKMALSYHLEAVKLWDISCSMWELLLERCKMLYKGICENRTLEFYLVTYDDIGGVTCRRFSDTRGQNSGYSPVFWTADTTFLEPPFSEQELDNYSRRDHIRDVASNHTETENKIISRVLCMSSSYDVVETHLSTPLYDSRNVEGRIWLYQDGTFGFGFVGSNSIIDLRHVSSAGCILDTLY